LAKIKNNSVKKILSELIKYAEATGHELKVDFV